MSGETLIRGRPMWLGSGVFALAHLPDGAARTGVVFASPFGWEEMGSYPVRRTWARTLAAAGWPVLRFDWPGTGDSAGDPVDPDRLGAWCEAFSEATDWLRAEAGVERIATIGLGLGGLVAVEAIRRGAVSEDLVLWPVFRDGRTFARAERALSRLQSAKRPEDHVLGDGWIESSGYLLSPDTLADLAPVEGWLAAPSCVERALLLDRDGTAVDPAVLDGFRAAGVEVQTAPGPGYVAMIYAPHWPKVPQEVIATVSGWLGRAPAGGAGAPRREVSRRDALELPGARERALEVPCQRGSAFAVLTEPERRDPALPTLVLVPAWAERRPGPNRLWTEAARRAAGGGAPAVRLDLPGIGDSIGDPSWLEYTRVNVHDPVTITELREVLDALSAQDLGDRFVLVGLSAGAYWVFQTIAADPRVVGALAINPSVELFAPQQKAGEVVRKLHYLLRPVWWGRIIRGEVRLSSMAALAWTAVRVRLRRRGPTAAAAGGDASPLRQAFTAIGERGGHLVLASIGEETLDGVLEAEGIAPLLPGWPTIRMVEIDSVDHNVRPVRAQRQVHELISELLDAARATSPDAASPAVPARSDG